MIILLRLIYILTCIVPLILILFEINDHIFLDELLGLISIILYVKLNDIIDRKLKLPVPSPSIILLPLFFIFFHLDYVLYDILDLKKYYFKNIIYYYSEAEKIFYLTNLCLFFVYFGRIIKRRIPYKNFKLSKQILSIIAFHTLIALTIITLPSLLRLAIQETYEGTDAGSVSGNGLIHLLVFFCCLSISTIILIKPYNKFLTYITIAFLIFNLILLTKIGDRNLLLLIIFSGLISYALSKSKKIKPHKILILGLILGTIYIGIEKFRVSKDAKISEIELVSSNNIVGYLEAFKSFESTKALTRASLDIDLSRYNHFYGKYTIFGIFGAVPYLAGTIAPLISYPGSPLSSSDVFTNEIKINTQSRYGLGTSLIGDLFLDLNIFGALLVFFLIGLNISGYENLLLNKDCKLFALIQISIISAYYFQSARYGIGILIRPVFYLLILKLLVLRR